MTWGEFKKELESKGVKDDMTLGYIDISSSDKVDVVIDSNFNDFYVEPE